MHPTFHLGPLDFPAYFTLLTIGYLLAVILAWRQTFRIPGVDPNKLLDLSIVVLIAGLLGARLLHVVADGYFWDYVNLCVDPMKVKGKMLRGVVPCTADDQCIKAKIGELCNLAAGTCHQGRDCLRAIKVWYGGLAFYGGFLGAMPVGIWYILRHRDRMVLWRVADLAGFGIALGLIFGRIGCWFSGCCFGFTTEGPLAVIFPKHSPAWDRHVDLDLINRAAPAALPVIPTQLIHVVSNFLIFVFCFIMFKRWRKFDGIVFWTFMILYAVSRFLIEYYRDDYRGVWLGGSLSTSQIIAIPAVLASIIMLVILKRRAANGDG